MADSPMDNPYRGKRYARLVLTYVVESESNGECVDQVREMFDEAGGIDGFERELLVDAEDLIGSGFKVVDCKVEVTK